MTDAQLDDLIAVLEYFEWTDERSAPVCELCGGWQEARRVYSHLTQAVETEPAGHTASCRLARLLDYFKHERARRQAQQVTHGAE